MLFNRVWLIRESADSDQVIVTTGVDREQAKRNAWRTLRGNEDKYVCTPLTEDDDTVYFDLVTKL